MPAWAKPPACKHQGTGQARAAQAVTENPSRGEAGRNPQGGRRWPASHGAYLARPAAVPALPLSPAAVPGSFGPGLVAG